MRRSVPALRNAALRVVAAAALLGGPQPGLAENPAIDVRQYYDVSVSGFRIGKLELAVNIDGARYTARGVVQGDGMIGALFRFAYGGTATGRILSDGALRPVRYEGVRQDDEREEIVMRYERGVPVAVVWTPERRKRKHDIDPADQGGTLDPISATVELLLDASAGEACGRSIEIYDGARRSRITIGAPEQRRDLIACAGKYSRVGGFSPKQMAEKVDFPFTIFYQQVDGMLRVDSFQVDSIIGPAVARRR